MVTILDRLAAVATDMQVLLSTICLGLTTAVVGNAFYQKQQFYPAVVYLTKSNASMAVIYVQFFVVVFMFGKLLRKIFLGTLRTAEFEHLLERFWYALTETCLAFTVFRDDFNPRFVALFTILLFLKSFHWLAEERVDFMERSPVLGWLFHIRVASLLFVLSSLDYLLLMHAYNSTLVRGPTVQLVFGFEYAILLTVITSIAIKYVLHAAEMQTDAPWENKAVILLYTELVIGLVKVVLYVLFVVIMARIYALPMFVFRPMFFTIRSFKKALSDVIMSRRAIRNMNTLYPDATAEELRLSDNICIICREDMVNHAKKLPCGHIFHTICLRSWFQRQQTCPTCRLNILRTPTRNSTAAPRAEEQAVPAAGAAAAAAPAPTNDTNVAGNNNNTETTNAGPTAPTNLFEGIQTNPTAAASFPNFTGMPAMMPPPPPFMMAPPFPFIAPYAVAPPPMPPDLSTLSDEELRAMEGNERQHIEERLKFLNNIKVMLDATTILMSNYQIISARYPTPVVPASAATAASASPSASTNETSSVVTDNEKPSTSRAAAASATSVNEVNQSQTTLAGKSKNAKQIDVNAVKLEDIGREELLDSVAATTTKQEMKTNEGENDTELCELRKRRLKYLQDLSKGSSASQD